MPKENRKKALDDAARCVLQNRNEAYGEPEENFNYIAHLQLLTDKCKHPAAKVALGAICVKIARLVRNPTHYDSWVDIAGYAACGADVTTQDEVDDTSKETLSEEMVRVTKDFIVMNHKDPNLEAARADNFRHWIFQDGKLVKVG